MEEIEKLRKKNKQLKERIEYLERSNNRREDTILEQRQEINDLEILIENLYLGVTLNKEEENLLDKILFGGDSNERNNNRNNINVYNI